jgi:SAM-dependent methyltransferase
MSFDQPQSWHYGLVARYWAEFLVDAPEVEFLRAYVQAGQPALDVACGTGRLLIPLLEQGLDVDGSDISPDMLASCRTRAERAGFDPNLYAQASHELDLPRRYRTIYACGSFGIGGDPRHDRKALLRLYDHLEPGGVLLLDHEMPYSEPKGWGYWTKEGRESLPEALDVHGWRPLSDGSEIALPSRVVDVDPLAQRLVMEMRPHLRRGGDVIEEQTLTLAMTLYTAKHIELLLEVSGFEGVQMLENWTDAPATGDTTNVTFVARRPF